MPIERMLRTIWPGDSSNAKYRQRLAARAGRVREVRGQRWSCRCRRCPMTRTRAAAEIALAAEHRVEPGDAAGDRARRETSCCRPSDVIGSTLMPSSSIRNGYSLVPCDGAAVLDDAQAPRRDLVDRRDGRAGSRSRRRTPPARGGSASPSPRSPVMTAVTPLSLSQRNRRRSSARRMASLRQPAEQRLDRVEHDALGADRVDRVAEADEQAFEVVVAGLLDLAALDAHVVDRAASSAAISSSRSKPSERTFCDQLLAPSPRTT